MFHCTLALFWCWNHTWHLLFQNGEIQPFCNRRGKTQLHFPLSSFEVPRFFGQLSRMTVSEMIVPFWKELSQGSTIWLKLHSLKAVGNGTHDHECWTGCSADCSHPHSCVIVSILERRTGEQRDGEEPCVASGLLCGAEVSLWMPQEHLPSRVRL